MSTNDRILVMAAPHELRPDEAGVVDVFRALDRQFFWADTVILGDDAVATKPEDEVLEGEIVG